MSEELPVVKGYNETLDFIKSQWSNNALPETCHPMFGSEDGIKKQLDTLYDNQGEVLYFCMNEKLEVKKVIADLTFEKPDDYEILGFNLKDELSPSK